MAKAQATGGRVEATGGRVRSVACYRRVTRALSHYATSGPSPARLVVGQLQRVILRGAGFFGVRSLEQLDEWVLKRMTAADRNVANVLANVEKAMLRLREAPETQRVLLKIPRWLPFSDSLRECMLSPAARQQSADGTTVMPFEKLSRVRLSRAAPTAPLHKLPTPLHGDVDSSRHPVQPFSRRALAATAPSALPPRIYDDATLAELQDSPKQAAPTFSRRKQAAMSATCARVFLDEETLSRLATQEDAGQTSPVGARARSAYSDASTNLHSSPPTDLASFNPPLPSLDVAGILDSVGNLFDANPAHPKTFSHPALA